MVNFATAPATRDPDSTSLISSKKADLDLTKAIDNTITQIRANPSNLQNTLSSLEELNASANKMNNNDSVGASTSSRSNSSNITANVEEIKLDPGNQREIFEVQMRQEEAEREAIRVAEMVIRQLEDLRPEVELTTQETKKADPVKLNPTEYSPENGELIGNINKELERFGIKINPEQALQNGTLIIEEDIAIELRREGLVEAGGIRNWMKVGEGRFDIPELNTQVERIPLEPETNPLLMEREALQVRTEKPTEEAPQAKPADRFAAALAARDLN